MELHEELRSIDNSLIQLNQVNKNFQSEGVKFMVIGEIKNAREQLFKNRVIVSIDTSKLSNLNEEKENMANNIKDIQEEKFVMRTLLNESIQRNYDKLNSMPVYKNSKTLFNETEMILQLQPETTPLIFGRYVREGRVFSLQSGAVNTATKLAARLAQQLPDQSERVVFLGRIGNGHPAASRSLRLPVGRLIRGAQP